MKLNGEVEAYQNNRNLFKLNSVRLGMEDIRMDIEKIKQERDAWRETALVAGNPETMKSIKKSLRQISSGKTIPLAQL